MRALLSAGVCVFTFLVAVTVSSGACNSRCMEYVGWTWRIADDGSGAPYIYAEWWSVPVCQGNPRHAFDGHGSTFKPKCKANTTAVQWKTCVGAALGCPGDETWTPGNSACPIDWEGEALWRTCVGIFS